MSRGNLITESLKRRVEPTAATSFAVSSAGVYTLAEIEAFDLLTIWNANGTVDVSSARGAKGLFYGTAADNSTGHAFRIYAMVRLEGRKDTDVQYDLKLLYSGTFTMGSMVGKDDQGAVKTTERFADTIDTWVTEPYGTFINAYMGASAITPFSPADNTAAYFGIQDGGNCAGYLVDLDAASGTIGCLLSRDI
jgi:hypothetical protein